MKDYIKSKIAEYISKGDGDWRTYDVAEFVGYYGETVIIGIRVNDKTGEACEAVLDSDGWNSDFDYVSVGVDSFDVASSLDFEGARAEGYVFPND